MSEVSSDSNENASSSGWVIPPTGSRDRSVTQNEPMAIDDETAKRKVVLTFCCV